MSVVSCREVWKRLTESGVEESKEEVKRNLRLVGYNFVQVRSRLVLTRTPLDLNAFSTRDSVGFL